jgi:xanthine dehydrogenase accessory factor
VADLDRIAAPVGLDIGSRTPAEIAISVMGQVIETLRMPK